MLCVNPSRRLFVLPLFLLLVSSQVMAQTPDGSSGGEPAPLSVPWTVAMNVKRFAESRLGEQLLALAEKEVRREFQQELEGGDLDAMRSKIAELLGFDPLEGVTNVYACGGKSLQFNNEDKFLEGLATNSVVTITLAGTTGNLEGLALATPGYQSEQYHGATIHSGQLPDIPPTVYMAVHKPDGDGANSVVFSFDEKLVKSVLDNLIGRDDETNAADASNPQRENAVSGEYFRASMKIDEEAIRRIGIPEQQSAVFKMFRRLYVSVGEEGGSVFVQLELEIINEQRAEQIQQLLQGLLALVELPIEIDDEEEFLMLREALKDIEVTRSGSQIECRVQKPVDVLMQLLTPVLDEL